MRYHVAQVNIARLLAPLDAPELADFVAALEPVNASADRAPGFVWRLQTEDGNATGIKAFEWDRGDSAGVLVNMSVWRSIDALGDWVYGDMHRTVLRRRREWFRHVSDAIVALWWVPEGHVPTVADAEGRVRSLRRDGPSPFAFTFRQPYGPPVPGDGPVAQSGREDWLCPA